MWESKLWMWAKLDAVINAHSIESSNGNETQKKENAYCMQ